MKKQSSEGYVLGWVLVVALVLVIFSISVLSVAAAYHKRVLGRQWQAQAYYTARSVSELVAGALCGKSEAEELADGIKRQLDEGNFEFEITVENLDPAMGTCRISVLYKEEEDMLLAVTSAEYNDKTAAVCVRMDRDQESGEFRIAGYQDGQPYLP